MIDKNKIKILEKLEGWQNFIEEFINKKESSNKKKEQLLRMAKNGELKPIAGKSELGSSLKNYINKSSDCYDSIFDKKIRELRSDWFITQKDTSNEKKKLLLEMAKNGESRPIMKSSLGKSFYYFTQKKDKCYDEVFYKEIKLIRPDWFNNSSDKNKKLLLEMAKNGEPRPISGQNPLGVLFCNYLNKNNVCYDENFAKQIKELRPDWFFGAKEKKQELIKIAKNKENRPNQRKHYLGYSLNEYIKKNRNAYDPEFDKLIRELAPHWFKK